MKKIFYVLIFLLPVVGFGQQGWEKSCLLDSMWMDVGNEGFTPAGASWTSVAVNSWGSPYVAFSDADYLGKMSVMRYNGISWGFVGNEGFSLGSVEYCSLLFSPTGDLYVAYSDNYYSNYYNKATVMKFDGTAWVTVGNAGFSANQALWTSLTFNPNGQPYVAFEDFGNSKKATVMMFNGTTWVNVGNAGFSADTAECLSIAFNTTGQPFVAFEDFGNSRKATVMKFDGTNWVNFGSAGFSEGEAENESLAFGPSGEPCVAFMDHANNGRVTVMDYNGTNWVNVGNAGFSDATFYLSLAFSQDDGRPYVAAGSPVSLMKFDGSSWVYVGNPHFSKGLVLYTRLCLDPFHGVPYVAYSDFANSGKATVMKYDVVYTGVNELQESRLLVFPNPAEDKCQVQSAKCHIKSVEIFNLSGERVYYSEFSSGTGKAVEVELNFPAGVYFVRVTGDETVEVGKIIKE